MFKFYGPALNEMDWILLKTFAPFIPAICNMAGMA